LVRFEFNGQLIISTRDGDASPRHSRSWLQCAAVCLRLHWWCLAPGPAFVGPAPDRTVHQPEVRRLACQAFTTGAVKSSLQAPVYQKQAPAPLLWCATACCHPHPPVAVGTGEQFRQQQVGQVILLQLCESHAKAKVCWPLAARPPSPLSR
jgi:hypothetical protein